jgi:hypothetical protein
MVDALHVIAECAFSNRTSSYLYLAANSECISLGRIFLPTGGQWIAHQEETDFHRHNCWIVGFCWSQDRNRGRNDHGHMVWRMDFEKELIDAFDRVVHKDFPNPQRINCPGIQILTRFATKPEDNELISVLAHLRECAPCFDELKEIRQKAQGNGRS